MLPLSPESGVCSLEGAAWSLRRALAAVPLQIYVPTSPRIWSPKAAGLVLGIHPKKAGQAIDPALSKVARLMIADETSTFGELFRWMAPIRAELERRGAELHAAG